MAGICYTLAAMRLLTSISVLILFLSSLSAGAEPALFDQTYSWPLKLPKKFSSGFGDTRPGRFHMGLDLRTGGKPGAKVFAPENGYVWRIKTGYRGYGKALYIKGESGRMYVFGHLQKYNWDIGTHLRQQQIDSRRYYQDIYPEPEEFPIKRGELIARTGQTGAGAPHLHYEIRDSDNRPTNPFYYKGVGVKDGSPPQFEAVWLSYVDDQSLFDDGRRELRLVPVSDGTTGGYIIRDTVVVTGRLAFKTAVDDIVTNGSFTLGPSKVSLRIDDVLYHEIDYDRMDFDENLFSILDKDTSPDKKNFKRVYNLYRQPGNRLSNYRSETGGDGTFSDTGAGLHTVVVSASDPSGNRASLKFAFYYFPNTRILAPLNRATMTDSSMILLFEPDHAPFDSLALFSAGIDSARVQLYPDITVNDYTIDLRGDFGGWNDYHLMFYSGGMAYPPVYVSIERVPPSGQPVVDSCEYDIIGDGILITARPKGNGINWLLMEIMTDAGSVQRFCRRSPQNGFACFYRPETGVGLIERIIIRGPVGFRPDTVSFDTRREAAGVESAFELRPGVSLSFDAGDLFADALLEIYDTIMPPPQTGDYVYGPYVIGPEELSFADWADLRSQIDDSAGAFRIGLYVYDEDDGWLWAGGEYDPAAKLLHSQLGGAGVIAVIADTGAPVISKLNIEKNGRVKIGHPPIRFILDDELSGIEDDLNFNVTIDDRWIVPEYDPEQKLFVSKPHWRLRGGAHRLKIEVHDRCGNRVTVSRKFRVRAKSEP